MAIHWGSNSVKIWTYPEFGHCPNCNNVSSFSTYLEYKNYGVLFIFSVSTIERYIFCCDACGVGKKLPENMVTELEDIISQNGISPIPFLDRCGLALLGIVLGVCLLGAYVYEGIKEFF